MWSVDLGTVITIAKPGAREVRVRERVYNICCYMLDSRTQSKANGGLKGVTACPLKQ